MGLREIAATEFDWLDGARQINQCEYLFAVGIREVEELELELTLVEAKPQAQIMGPRDKGIIDQLRVDGSPILRDATCRLFQLIFDRRHLVSYAVLNESYGKYPESPESFTGKLFRVFSWSNLLEFTKRTSHASDEHPGVLQHYEIACLNHVIDVICTAPPRIVVRIGQPETESVVH
jgi:hypothetical protein